MAYLNRGFTYFNKGDYERAIVDLDKALEMNPDLAGASEWREEARRRRDR